MTGLDNHHRVEYKRALPAWALGVGVLLTVAAVGLLAWTVFSHLSAYVRASDEYVRLDDTQRTVAHLDDLTAMSVRLAVSNDNVHWREQYQRHRDQRDAVVDHVGGPFASAILQTYGTIAHLRAVEDQIFDLLQSAEREQAEMTVFDGSYDRQLQEYRHSVAIGNIRLREGVDDLVANARRRAYLAGGISLATTAALTLVWIGLMKLMQRYVAARRDAELLLRQAQQELEAQVDRRTRDLSDTNHRLQEEIERRKSAEEQLEHGALHDVLTDLPNRALLIDRLNRCVERARRQPDYMIAVLVIDIDEFKVINDSLGHTIGNELLVEAADRLQSSLRLLDTVSRSPEQDTMGRTGGDEFVIVLEDIHGIATSQSGETDPHELLRDADTALHRAKKHGKARHVVFNHDMRVRAVERLEVEGDLRKAIEEEQLFLQYQPIVCLETGAIEGFEALVRWRHPTRGLVMPNDFIPVAEETGLIVPMGRWVLSAACRQLRAWRQRFVHCQNLNVAVNLFVRQFNDPGMLEHIDQALLEVDLPSQHIKLEITESVLMEDTDATDHIVAELKARKLDLHLDDFGTGYSSLSYLHNLPVDALKIDRSFIANMGTSGGNTSTIAAVVTLAQNQGIRVIAEGIETAEQAAKLRALNRILHQPA